MRTRSEEGEENGKLFANYTSIFFSLTNQPLPEKRSDRLYVRSRGNKAPETVSTLTLITLRAAALSINLLEKSGECIHLRTSRATKHIILTLL